MDIFNLANGFISHREMACGWLEKNIFLL